MSDYILSIDQGTSSSRAMIFDVSGNVISSSQKSFEQHYPGDGWVEHNPEDIWQSVLSVSQNAILEAPIVVDEIKALGITNQRETTIIWEVATGKPIYPAIVWQDRRTAAFCEGLTQEGYDELFKEKTGLTIDPYFSGTKIHWILDYVKGARKKAEAGELAFGTVDSYLLWQLTGGKVHATDATNASRSLLFNIHDCQWDEELLEIFNIPESMLPEVKSSNSNFGVTDKAIFGHEIPITGIAGDQHAALIGQACITPGAMKSTYGTGTFMMVNTGDEMIVSQNNLITTLAYHIDGKPTYAIEGSIFIAGALIDWLKDKSQMIKTSEESEVLSAAVEDTGGVTFVPAFTGLGAPYWDPEAKGAILGLTRDTSRAHIVRAALESVAFQTLDLMMAMEEDGIMDVSIIRVDGGMVKNKWLCQQLADMLQITMQRPKTTEITTVGAAFLAGLGAGIFNDLSEVNSWWVEDNTFLPNIGSPLRDKMYLNWQKAVKRVTDKA